MKRFGWLVVCALLCSKNLTAQDTTDASPYPWRTSYFPYVTLSPNDGLMGLFRLVYFRQARFEDRVSLRDAVAVEAGYSTRNSWLVRARGDFPRIAEGWRIQADAQISSTRHFGDQRIRHDEMSPGLDRHDHESRSVTFEVTRRISGPLQLAMRGGAAHVKDQLVFSDAHTLYPSTPFISNCQFYGDPPGDGEIDNPCRAIIAQNDLQGRVALVLDLRDREFDTNQGALFEGGVFTGTAEDGYRGAYGYARGWAALRTSTRVTARAGFRALSRSGAIGIQQELPTWERSTTILGGPQSQRGLAIGEESARGLLLAGVEVRQEVKRFLNGLASITVLGFVDGGRAFRELSPLVDPVPGSPIPNGNLRLTLDGWQVSVGGGVAVRVLKDASLNVTAAHHPGGGTTWYVSSGWAW